METSKSMAATPAWRRDFETLVLPSGGAKGMALLGALGVMERIYGSPLFGPGSRLRRMVGVSVGAVVGMFLAIGMPVEEIKSIVSENRSWQDLMKADPWRLLDGKLGMNDGKDILALLREHLKRRTGDPDVTLAELHRTTGVALVCVSCRIESALIDFVGPFAGEKGSVKVCDAVFDSMRVPPFFDPNFREDEHVVDGGLLCTNPFAYLQMLGIDPRTSLGMCFVESPRANFARSGEDARRSAKESYERRPSSPFGAVSGLADSQQGDELDLVDYFHMLAYASARVLERFQRASVPDWLWDWNVVQIPVDKVGDVELRAGPVRLKALMAAGEEAARKFFVRRLLASGLVETVAVAAVGDRKHENTTSSVDSTTLPFSPAAFAQGKVKED